MKILKETVSAKKAELFAYCFMPDHLHLLISGGAEFPLKDFMKVFKQKSSYNFRKEYGQSLWQRSYYDHVLRKEEDIRNTVLYILNNPVRKGLVTGFKDYPLLGSEIFKIDMDEPY